MNIQLHIRLQIVLFKKLYNCLIHSWIGRKPTKRDLILQLICIICMWDCGMRLHCSSRHTRVMCIRRVIDAYTAWCWARINKHIWDFAESRDSLWNQIYADVTCYGCTIRRTSVCAYVIHPGRERSFFIICQLIHRSKLCIGRVPVDQQWRVDTSTSRQFLTIDEQCDI
jgi:hypothetical protein